MRQSRGAVVVVFVFVFGVPHAATQPLPPLDDSTRRVRLYTSGGLSLVRVEEGYHDRYLVTTIGGNTTAITAEVGIAGRSLAFGGEVSFVQAVTAQLRGRSSASGIYSPILVSGEWHHSDVLLTGLLHPLSVHRVLDPVVGVTLGRGHDRFTDRVYQYLESIRGTPTPVSEPRRAPDDARRQNYLGIAAGLNVLRPVGRRLHLGGSVRWTWFDRSRTNRDDGPSSGVGASLFNVGAIVRFK